MSEKRLDGSARPGRGVLAVLTPAVAFIVAAMLAGSLLFARQPRHAVPYDPAATEDGVSVYFSPKGGCAAAVVEQIKAAEKTVDMQAYSFTNADIAQALVGAAERGVKVRVILDSKAAREEHREPEFIVNHNVATYTDAEHPIAHNKIIVVDAETVITGSFNFTQQAENSNAENLLVITGKPKLAAAYEANFEKHLKHSERYTPPAGN